jgi:hypothetical protein
VLRQPQPAGALVELVLASPLACVPASAPTVDPASAIGGAQGSASGLPFQVPGVAIA